MANPTNQPSTSSESYEDDETAANLVDVLCNVIDRCNFNGYDLDLLLATAARRRINQLMVEQAEERRIS